MEAQSIAHPGELQTNAGFPPDALPSVKNSPTVMLDLLELLIGVLDGLLDVCDLIEHWRFSVTAAISAGAAYVLYHHLPWDTANALISVITGLSGVVAGIVWEASGGSH